VCSTVLFYSTLARLGKENYCWHSPAKLFCFFGPRNPLPLFWSDFLRGYVKDNAHNSKFTLHELRTKMSHTMGNIVLTGVQVASLQSIRGEETGSVNKPSPVSPQLTARSGQSAQLVQCTHCIRTHVNLYSNFGHPCNGTRFT
jgi:hypothetical protein